MLQRISEYILSNHLIEEGDRIVLGVSGGADSVCLLHVLCQFSDSMKFELRIVHVNHGIRGKEAEHDEEFVRMEAQKLGRPLDVFRYDVRKIASEEGLSEEEAGRKVRYQAFADVCRRYGCNKIAVAHNRNDSAETMLFHLFRGSGIRGLSGIPPSRRIENEDLMPVTVIRPLLEIQRSEIEEFIEKHGLAYCTDSTNNEETYSRNKIRRRVLSYVTDEINSNAVEHIAQAADKLGEISRYIDKMVEEKFERLVTEDKESYIIPAAAFQREDIVIRKGILWMVLERLSGSRKNMGSQHLESVLELLDKQVGKQVDLPYGICAVREYEQLRCYMAGKQEDLACVYTEKELHIPGTTVLQGGKYIHTVLFPYENHKIIPKNSCTKWIDYDKIENVVTIRQRKSGDYIQVNRQGGRKKIKDYLIDRKIPQKDRDSILLIADGSHIIWLPEEGRISEGYKIDGSTKNILELKIVDTEEDRNGWQHKSNDS